MISFERHGTIKLRYGNSKTFYTPGGNSGLLVGTDWAGTLQPFLKAIKATGIEKKAITTLLLTHYYPNHMGLSGELQQLGAKLLIADVQCQFVFDKTSFCEPFFHFCETCHQAKC